MLADNSSLFYSLFPTPTATENLPIVASRHKVAVFFLQPKPCNKLLFSNIVEILLIVNIISYKINEFSFGGLWVQSVSVSQKTYV